MKRTLAATALAAATLTACGHHADTIAAPDCAKVWRAGAILPANYDGCREGGEFLSGTPMVCSGARALFTMGQSEWAFTGGKVQRVKWLQSNPGYLFASTQSCRPA